MASPKLINNGVEAAPKHTDADLQKAQIEGYECGHKEGHSEGYSEGLDEGWDKGAAMVVGLINRVMRLAYCDALAGGKDALEEGAKSDG